MPTISSVHSQASTSRTRCPFQPRESSAIHGLAGSDELAEAGSAAGRLAQRLAKPFGLGQQALDLDHCAALDPERAAQLASRERARTLEQVAGHGEVR